MFPVGVSVSLYMASMPLTTNFFLWHCGPLRPDLERFSFLRMYLFTGSMAIDRVRGRRAWEAWRHTDLRIVLDLRPKNN